MPDIGSYRKCLNTTGLDGHNLLPTWPPKSNAEDNPSLVNLSVYLAFMICLASDMMGAGIGHIPQVNVA